MKILHVAQDLDTARVPPGVLHALAQDVTLTWAGTPASALEWLTQNTDAAAVIVEVEAQSCAPFVRSLRASRLQTPVVVVDGSARLDAAIGALNAGADGYVLADLLEHQLPEVVSQAIDRGRTRAREHADLAAELVAQRRQLARETRLCTALQEQSLQFEAALIKQEKRRAAEAAVFADLLGARQQSFAERIEEISAVRDALATELLGAKSALDLERESRAGDAEAARAAMAAAVAEVELAHQTTRALAASELAEVNERCEALQLCLSQEIQRRASAESRYYGAVEEHAAIVEEHAAVCRSLERHLDEARSRVESLAEQASVDRATFEANLAAAREGQHESEQRANRILEAALGREAELIEQLETESAAKAVAESQRAAGRRAAARRRDRSLLVVSKYRQHVRGGRQLLETDLARERGAHDRTRSLGEADRRRLIDDAARLQQSLSDLQSAFQQLDQVAGDHASARHRLEALVSERERQMADETERHLAVEDDTHRYIARLQGRLRHTTEESQEEAARLHGEIDALRRDVDAARAHAQALRGSAERVPDLVAQLEKSRNERRREFERAPYGLCRCDADGTVIEANHSFLALLGYRRTEDLKNLGWFSVPKEQTGDLDWLLKRAQATRKSETVETQWFNREGQRVLVRLQASATPSGTIDIVAEDVTLLRGLEARLRQAQKMEAVGRLASEVAVTCDAILGNVVSQTQDCLEAGQPADLRYHTGQMLDEITRAQGFLHRLDSYGDEQKRALEPVSAQRVLRDLAPVLKRLVGERIELALPKATGAFPVDVDAERLERVLTNVAAYARERMPMGGQVRIDLATMAIGRRFAAGHSSVRAGDHVLITVTEVASAAAEPGDAPRHGRSTDTGGMELGVLVDLISSCGGHLWLEAQPAGNMVVKIHLPKPAVQEDRGRLSRWLRAASVATILT